MQKEKKKKKEEALCGFSIAGQSYNNFFSKNSHFHYYVIMSHNGIQGHLRT